MHTMSRVRSSSRCSMRLSRSSWPIGFATAIRPGGLRVRARGGLVLPARLASHDLGLRGRAIELRPPVRPRGLAERVAVLVVIVVVAALARDGLLELAHAGAELAAQTGQPL